MYVCICVGVTVSAHVRLYSSMCDRERVLFVSEWCVFCMSVCICVCMCLYVYVCFCIFMT